jgi:ribose-phosphate pyrophosphokinase
MKSSTMNGTLKIFSCNANIPLAESIAKTLETPLGKMEVKRFSDGEIFIEVGESVRGKDCFIIQPTSAPVNDHLLELLIGIDALKRASAESITAVIPYYGYARQDRKISGRTPISAKLVADLITAAGATRVVAMDLHAGQIQGFFDVPFDHLFPAPVFLEYLKKNYKVEDFVIVAPDAGGVERARFYAKRLQTNFAIIDKRRTAINVAKAMNIVGDVKGKTAVIVDDIVDTAGTLTQGVDALIEKGAKEVIALCTHPVLSGPALERLEKSQLKAFITTDTIQLDDNAKSHKGMKVLSVAGILAEAMKRIHNYDSVSELFE